MLYGIMITQVYLYLSTYKKWVISTVFRSTVRLISEQGSQVAEMFSAFPLPS